MQKNDITNVFVMNIDVIDKQKNNNEQLKQIAHCCLTQ